MECFREEIVWGTESRGEGFVGWGYRGYRG